MYFTDFLQSIIQKVHLSVITYFSHKTSFIFTAMAPLVQAHTKTLSTSLELLICYKTTESNIKHGDAIIVIAAL